MKTEPSLVTMTEPQRSAPPAGSSILRSTLLLFLLPFPVYFMFLVFHEGGHVPLPSARISPRDLRSLLVVPAALFLWSVVGLIVGTLFVPGSPIDVAYGLGEELLPTARSSLVLYLIFGVVLAGTYVTLYRWVYPRLPAWLRTEIVSLTWKDLGFPAVLAVICVVVGILIIT